MQNLTQANYFNGIKSMFPQAYDYFINWLQDYMVEVDWNKLFDSEGRCTIPTFFDLPFEMQNGIIARFELEVFNNKQGQGKLRYEMIAEDYKHQVKALLADLQMNINNKRFPLN